MSEFNKLEQKKYDNTSTGLGKRLEDIALDFLAYTKPDVTHKNTTMLLLDTTNGERVIISKSTLDAQADNHFFQDLNMSVHPGRNQSFYAQQVDFNFGQRGDGELRKRVISGKENDVEPLPFNASSVSNEDINHIALLSLHHARESAANMQLEEYMGLNNQPATVDEIAEAMTYLDGATVVDPNSSFPFKPVGTVESR